MVTCGHVAVAGRKEERARRIWLFLHVTSVAILLLLCSLWVRLEDREGLGTEDMIPGSLVVPRMLCDF